MNSPPDARPRWRVFTAGSCAVLALRLTKASEWFSDLGRAILWNERFSDVRQKRADRYRTRG
jgi:hypothetical protein